MTKKRTKVEIWLHWLQKGHNTVDPDAKQQHRMKVLWCECEVYEWKDELVDCHRYAKAEVDAGRWIVAYIKPRRIQTDKNGPSHTLDY